jgi:hypothetical protein
LNYLQLVNKVIQESGKEQNELDMTTWGQPEAGRRLYPRIKRYVSDAWRELQMSRNEWEFKNKEITTLILPRFLVDGVVFTSPSIGPAPGVVYKGQDTGLVITVVDVLPGPETDEFYVDFSADGGYNRALIGEVFEETAPNAGDSSFVYRGRGAYRLRDLDPLMREPSWSTFIGYQGESTPTPIRFIPWENWLYKEISYTTSTRSAPSFVSQDYKGDLVFYPQTLSPVNVNFVYDTAPQELDLPTDVPLTNLLPAEYHEWIAWIALGMLARYDKDPDLLAHADKNVSFYKNRAERNLMPVVRWAASKFNNNYWPIRGTRG